jgi:peptidoglycan/LPS O-acetylase OafA/YrhL
MGSKDNVYFLGLNGLRAIAAIAVVLSQIDQFSYLFGLKSIGFCNSGIASDGVILFFVLSGFLITFLLLKEKKVSSNINIRNFYIRRVLRIWPIYYTVIIVTCFLLGYVPTIGYKRQTLIPSISLFALMMANISYVLYYFTSLAPLWSVGVEEQFYLFWPLVVNKLKNIPLFLFIFIFTYIFLTYGLHIFANSFWYQIVRLTSFDCMAFGAFGACLVFYKSKYLRYIYHPVVQVVAIVLVLVPEVYYKFVNIPRPVRREYFGLLFLVVILNVSTNSRSILILENKVLDYLGKISYGIYVYHMLIISILAMLLHPYLSVIGSVDFYVLMYVSVVFVTLAISSISYFYYESRFLRLKKAYAVVNSSNSRNDQ